MNALLALVLAAGVPAQADTGQAFLKIPVGARAVGMGGAATAAPDDAHAAWWNPAGLGALPKPELAATHVELFADLRYDFAAFAQPLGPGTLGVSVAHLGKGDLDGRDESGRRTGSFSGRDIAVGVSFGRPVAGATMVGGGLKVVRAQIADVSATGVAVDLGLTQRFTPAVAGGLAVRNLGPGLRFLDERSALPLTLASGVSISLPMGLTLAAEASYRPGESRVSLSGGVEYGLFSAVALRGGYANRTGGKGEGGLSELQGLATGLGLKMGRVSADYAFTPLGELGPTHRFSLGLRF